MSRDDSPRPTFYLSDSEDECQPASCSIDAYPWLTKFCAASLYSYAYQYDLTCAFHSRLSVLKKSLQMLRDSPEYKFNASRSLINIQNQAPFMSNGLKSSVSSATLSFLSSMNFLDQSEYDLEHDIDQLLGLLNEAIDKLPQRLQNLNDSPSTRTSSMGARTVSNPPFLMNKSPDASLSHSTGPINTTTGRNRTLTNISSAQLRDRLFRALARPYLDMPIRNSMYIPQKRPALTRNYSMQETTPRTTEKISDSSSAGISSLVSALSLQPDTPGFSSSPLHPLSSKYAAVRAMFTTSVNAPFNIYSCNDMACLMFGISQSDMKGRPFINVIHKDSKIRFQRRVDRLMVNDGVFFCGDLFPITKANGVKSAASLWAKNNHRDVMIWILEEVSCDFTLLHVSPSNGEIRRIEGDHLDYILGLGSKRETDNKKETKPDSPESFCTLHGGKHQKGSKSLSFKLHISELLPSITDTSDAATSGKRSLRETLKSLDENLVLHETVHLDNDSRAPCFMLNVESGVQTEDGIVAVELASVPHISGTIIIDKKKLKICDYNKYFLFALLGYPRDDDLNGQSISSIIPQFQTLFDTVQKSDDPLLNGMPVGLVIPEYAFRKAARGSLPSSPTATGQPALSDNFGLSGDLMEPSCIEAINYAGASVKVDIQLRVVTADHYALWITYCRYESNSGLQIPSQLDLLDSYLSKREAIENAKKTKSSRSPGSSRSSTVGSVSSEAASTDVSSLATTPTEQGPPEHEAYSREVTPAQDSPLKNSGPYSGDIGSRRRTKSLDDFVILNKMGEGAYGKVLLVKYKEHPDVSVVLKCVIKERILVDTWTRDRKLGTIPNEIKIMAYLVSVPHPNIVGFLDFFEDEKYYQIEMEPHGHPGTDLFDLIEIQPNMPEEECKMIFKQIVDAVLHLHKHGIVHRDIKDENIVVDEKGRVKLIDFGSSAFTKQGPFDVFVGTIDYAAPEVLSGNPYEGKAQDVWAMGILLYTLVYKENPFYNVDEIMDGDLRIPFDVSDNCISLIKWTLTRNVHKRPTIQEIADHEWFS